MNDSSKDLSLFLLHCNVLRLCERIDSLFHTTNCEGPQNKEWDEFFKPAIMDVLQPFCEQLLCKCMFIFHIPVYIDL